MNYQKRSWNKENFQKKLPILRTRERIKLKVKDYFRAEGFDEVDTPSLQISPGLEPHLHAFSTKIENLDGSVLQDLYLHTSPEFAMKKLLVAGMEKIFQFAKVYRNREYSNTHHPEFTMLEWYRVGEGYESLMDDCEEVLKQVANVATKEGSFLWNQKTCNPFDKGERISVEQAFLHYCGISLFDTIDDQWKPSMRPLAEKAKELSVHFDASDSWDDIFFRIFFEKIEPYLGVGKASFLYGYPVHMAALSRVSPKDPRIAERFELYICGLELANAFGELADPIEQRRRFNEDMKLKQKIYGKTYPIDEDFMAALDFGFPESSGIALGFDRLAVLATHAKSVDDVQWLPVQTSND
ncbi:MAG: EF-P lysine aminoacylase EpmA [Oligoflexia bacterium]|nr:EF-P lysine aminoacylase EpmA [Oligoflexia bacterium]